MLPFLVLGTADTGRDTPALARRAGIAAAALVVALVAPGRAPAAHVRVAPTQKLAAVLLPHGARTGPDLRAHLLGVVQPRRPLTGEQTLLPVLGRRRGPQGALWLHVLLPGRPNGHTGWIRRAGTRPMSTSWSVVVDVTRRQVDVYRRGRRVRTLRAVVGKPSTPTPQGRFFVEEKFRVVPGGLGGPFAIALSARSTVYQEFDGGPGQIAVHGVQGIGGRPGTAASHGCIRLDTGDMAWLGVRIGPGVPVTIVS